MKITMQTDLESLGFSCSQCAILRALLLRASLGGMNCDVAMLKNAAHLWASRFVDAGCRIAVHDPRFVLGLSTTLINDDLLKLYAPSPVHVDVATVEYLDDEDLPLSAVDQHCSDVMTAMLSLQKVRLLLPQSDKIAADRNLVLDFISIVVLIVCYDSIAFCDLEMLQQPN